MVYTDIQQLRGLLHPVDYGSGIEYADGLLKTSPFVGLQIGLWLNGTAGCTDLLSGKLNGQVKRLFRYLIVECQATKIFLRVGYEFDNPSFGYDNPSTFHQAFRCLVETCDRLYSRRMCSSKIAFVWHSWGAGTPRSTSLADFYPGNDCVDWIGVSIFSQLYTERARLGNRATVEAVLKFAAAHGKPAMIAESTPFGGIDQLSDPWNDWFDPVIQLISEFDIAMWSYINSDWESQPMWHGVGFGDTRLSSNATVMQLWKRHVLVNPRFLTQLSCADGDDNNGKSHRHHHVYSRRSSSSTASLLLLPPPRDALWSIGPFYGKAQVDKLTPPLESPMVYWICAIIIVAAVLVCLLRDALLLCCRVNGAQYEALDHDEDDPVRIVEPNRTGYGSLG